MRSALCLLTGLAVGAGMQTLLGQQREIVSLNHVAIAVPDFDAASRFYSEGMGFRTRRPHRKHVHTIPGLPAGHDVPA